MCADKRDPSRKLEIMHLQILPSFFVAIAVACWPMDQVECIFFFRPVGVQFILHKITEVQEKKPTIIELMYIVKSAQNTNIRICSLCRRSAANTQYLHYNHNAILTCASILTKSLAILPLVGRHVCKRSIYFHNKCCLLRHSDYHVICGTEIYTHIYAYTLRSSIHVVNPLWMIKTSAKIIIK